MWAFQKMPQLRVTVIQTEQEVDQYIEEYEIEWKRHSTLVKIEQILNDIWQRLEETSEKQNENWIIKLIAHYYQQQILNKMKSMFDKAKHLLAVAMLQIELMNKLIDSADEHTNTDQNRMNLTNPETEQEPGNRLTTLN